jgi:hypothetical protein
MTTERTPSTLAQQVKSARDLMLTWSPAKKENVRLEGHDIYAPKWPQEGDLVRYDHGSTALAICGKPHAGGWHGRQCMGGTTFFNKAHRPTPEDVQMWDDCAKWRRK